MEPTMVMSRHQIEDRRKKAQQKREEKATHRAVKRSKRLTKDSTDILEGVIAPTNVPNISMNVSANDLNFTEYLLPEGQNQSSTELTYVTNTLNTSSNDLNLTEYLLSEDQNQSSTQLAYVTYTLDTSDNQYLDHLVNQPWDFFEPTSETNTLPSTTLTESTDQDGLVELIETLLNWLKSKLL